MVYFACTDQTPALGYVSRTNQITAFPQGRLRKDTISNLSNDLFYSLCFSMIID